MTWRDRLRLAGAALKTSVGLFDEQSLRATHGLLTSLLPGRQLEPPARGTRDRLAAYKDMPWLRACAERVADSVASTEWQLFVQRRAGRPLRHRGWQRAGIVERRAIAKRLRDHGEAEALEQHVLLDQVLDRGNSYLTGHAVQKVTQLHLDLAGEAFWLKERDGLGTVIGVWPLPAHWVLGTPTPARPIYQVAFRGWQQEIPETEVLWMASVDPEQPYGRGTGLTGALADDLEIDEYVRRQTKQTFFNGAQPPFIVYPKGSSSEPGQWSEAETRRAEANWNHHHQGFWQKAKPMFSTRELGIYEFGQDLQLQAAPIRQQERDTIIQVWGIPPEMFGILDASNRATIEGADYIYERYVVQPRREFLRRQLQERLVLEYDERLVLDYVSTVPEDKAYALQVAQAAGWTLTANEWRAMQGQAPLDGPEGAIRMVPYALTAVRTLEDTVDRPAPPSDRGTPPVPPPDDESDDEAAPAGEMDDDMMPEGDGAKAAPRRHRVRQRGIPTVTTGHTVTIPQAPIQVHVAPTPVNITTPEPKKLRRVIERDARGFAVAVRDEEIDDATEPARGEHGSEQ